MIKWLAIIAVLIFCDVKSCQYGFDKGYEQGQIEERKKWVLRNLSIITNQKYKTKEDSMAKVIKYEDLKWTLTEERLPEKDGDYLVTIPLDHTPYVFILGFHDGKFFGDHGEEPNNKRVIAWMELPEPYRKEAVSTKGESDV